ncbi:hypothetical protein, partial [Aquicoccus sp.]|uniref:hypothetical protein n=1 Tax=Aquicoccus sp. TaxID=2055851 RepID=UPI00356462F1
EESATMGQGRRYRMKKQPRWIKSVIETAQRETTTMPWQRGTRRQAMIAKRRNNTLKSQTA